MDLNWIRIKRIKQNIIIILSTRQDPIMPNGFHPQAHISVNICLINIINLAKKSLEFIFKYKKIMWGI